MRIPQFTTLCALLGCFGWGTLQAADFLDPNDILEVWDFNDSSKPDQSASVNQGTVLEFNGDAAFSSDRRGRSGSPGDRALDLGTNGSQANPTHAILVSDTPTGGDFVSRLNESNEKDQLSVAFWQRWHGGVESSATVWFTSPSAGSGDRGFQAHLPWGNGSIFFDTSGCCASPSNRLSGNVPGIDWDAWHHVALIKNEEAKQVWINGKLALNQESGASPLLKDWTGLVVGQSATEPQFAFHGLVDDLAIFGVALDEEQIKQLASGSSPMELAVPLEQQPPNIRDVFPAHATEFHPIDGGLGFRVTTESPNSIPTGNIKLFLNGQDVSSQINISGTGTDRRITYTTPLVANQNYTVRATASDAAGRATSSDWTFNTFDPLEARANLSLDTRNLGIARHGPVVVQNDSAQLAIDGRSNTFSESPNQPGTFWEFELERPVWITRVEITAPSSAGLGNALQNVVLRAGDLQNRLIFESSPHSNASGGLWKVDIPGGNYIQWLRLERLMGTTNGEGDHRIAIAEMDLFGDPMPETGPIQLDGIAVATYENVGSVQAASRAIDGDFDTFSESADASDGQWLLSLDRSRLIHHIELVSPSGNARSRQIQGLLVEVLDESSNVVANATANNPGSQGVWTFNTPPNTRGRFVRISLPDGRTNGAGNHVISLAEVLVFTSENLALNKDAYMVRLVDNLPAASNGNDGKYNTHTESTSRTVDAYWETDLGEEKALSLVRVISEDGFQRRMTHATVRLFDDAHNSIYSLHLGGRSEFFDVPLPGPVRARYIRVGYENKERSDPPGVSWHLGLKELQAFGHASNQVGLTNVSFEEAQNESTDASKVLWEQKDLNRLTLYPGDISLGAFTQMDGSGSYDVLPSVSTEYILVGTLHGETDVRHITVPVGQSNMPPQITEFVADNKLSLRDCFGESSDWIELHNPNNTPLSLDGYGLSDNPSSPMKWKFPQGSTIEAHGYLVVFASSKNSNRDEDGELHTNFSLDSKGESIQLTAPNGTTVVDQILNYPSQGPDLAYGRDLNGQWTFQEPTPNAANVAMAYEGWLAPVVFSETRGFHESTFNLTLTHPTESVTLLYSTDGSTPNRTYTGPIRISDNTTVRASAVLQGFKSPRVQTHSYLSIEKTLNASNMNRTITRNASFAARIRKGMRDLPVISISVPELPDDWNEREASIEVFMPDDSSIQSNAGLKRFGGAWTNFSKKNYRLKFRPEYGNRKLKFPLFDGFDHGTPVVDVFDEIDLRAGGHDMNSRGFYMSARFSEDTMLDMGAINPHGRFVHLFFNGTYWGQYHARERLTDAFLADYLGGKTEDYVNVRGNDNVGSSFVQGTPDPTNRSPWENVLRFKGDYQRLREWVDVPHLIDFMLMWNLGNAETEYRSAGPVASGSGFKFWLGDADGLIRSTSDRTGNSGPAGIFGALASERHPDFMTLLADRIHLHLFNDGALTGTRNVERLQERMDEIADSLVAESARWGFRNPSNWESEARNAVNQILPSSATQLRQRLERRGLYPSIAAPKLSQHGGLVETDHQLGIQLNGGDLYFTLDGSDPRLPGGRVSPTAQIRRANGASGSQLTTAGATWRYLDAGAQAASNWASTTFDDADWKQGKATLGYGDAGMSTTLSFGGNSGNKAITYYFRQTFNVSDPTGIERLTLNLVRDDGAVIYLNGREVLRDNMPSGEINSSTRASSAAGGNDESAIRPFDLDASVLREGRNVLAVEVHQTSPTSSDLRFDAWLQGATDASLGLSLSNNTHIKARAFDGRNWSALTEAQFFTEAPQAPKSGDILITELNYNPDGPDEFEFIELMNRSNRKIDLSGLRLEGGIDFIFPDNTHLDAGGIGLVAENMDSFAVRYQDPASPYYFAGTVVVGQWSGRLNDAGERIQLLNSENNILLDMNWDDDNGWPVRPDGLGSSLELRNPLEISTDATIRQRQLLRPIQWKASSLFHGSPGRLDEEPMKLVINEVLAHSDIGLDWIELHNLSDQPLSLKDHFLSDHYDTPFRYSFLESVSIEPNAYLLLDEDDLGFAFSELGSPVLLTVAEDEHIKRFIDSAQVPAVDRERSYGRFQRLDGNTDFTQLITPTPGQANAGAAIGPIIISEIMYHPIIGNVEYLELTHIGTTPVPLYDPNLPQNTWALNGGVEFNFPQGIVMQPDETILISALDPGMLRDTLSLNEGIKVFGPWSGALENRGERLVLDRPGDPELDGTIPRYVVDAVRYDPGYEWLLEAEGKGSSIERSPIHSYGNDPLNWLASIQGGTPGNTPSPLTFQLPELADKVWPVTIPLTIDAAVITSEPVDIFQYVATGLPPGISINASTGEISGIATEPGNFIVVIQVTHFENPNQSQTKSFQLSITPLLQMTFAGIAEDGAMQFTFDAHSMARYEIQSTDDLIQSEWQTIETFNTASIGTFTLNLPIDTNVNERFYRLIWVTNN